MYKKIFFGGLSAIIFGLVGVLFVYMQGDQKNTSIDDMPHISTTTTEAVQAQGKQKYDLIEQEVSQRDPGVEQGNLVGQEVVDAVQETVVFAPDFSLLSLDEQSTFILRSFAGQKPVIVDFFAAHCPNCRRNLPKLEALYGQYSDQVEVVLIGIDSRADTERFFANNPTDIPVVMTNNAVLIDYNIRLTNTKALINRDGSLLEIVEFRDIVEDDFLRLIES